jgi:hypothetical protein
MEAASTPLVPAKARKNRRVTFGTAPVVISTVGAVVGIVGMFLKAFNPPDEWVQGGFTGSTTYISTTGGAKILLGALVVGLIFLLLAVALHRKGVLWGTYLCGAVAILFGVLNAAGGFTISGSDVTAKATVGVFVALAGGAVMFAGAIAARVSARPDA